MRTFSNSELSRVCRDLAHAELSALASPSSLQARLPSRLCSDALHWPAHPDQHEVSPGLITIDSLARVTLATAAATWCNAHDSGYSDLFLAKRSVADWVAIMQRARAGGARDFTFATSGTTGTRKFIRHSEELLALEAQAWAELVRTHITPQRVVVLCPTHHIYGFIWGVLVPHALDIPVVDLAWDEAPEFQSGDLIIAVPDQWSWYAKSRPRWPEGCIGISSTAPLHADAHQTLIDRGLPTWTIYGSSETAGLGWRAAPEAAYQLFGNRVRMGDSIGIVLPNGQHSPLQVQDQLEWHTETTYTLAGRLDAVVQVGGHNVSPAWVREQLLAHPQVQDASVRLDTQREPARLKAFIVPDGPAKPDLSAIIERLPAYAQPAPLSFGSELPRNAMGKLCDWIV